MEYLGVLDRHPESVSGQAAFFLENKYNESYTLYRSVATRDGAAVLWSHAGKLKQHGTVCKTPVDRFTAWSCYPKHYERGHCFSRVYYNLDEALDFVMENFLTHCSASKLFKDEPIVLNEYKGYKYFSFFTVQFYFTGRIKPNGRLYLYRYGTSVISGANIGTDFCSERFTGYITTYLRLKGML